MIEIKRIENENEEPLLKVVYFDTDSVKEITKDEHYYILINNTLASCEPKDLDFELFLMKYALRSDYRLGKITLKEWWKYRTYLFKKYIERVVNNE